MPFDFTTADNVAAVAAEIAGAKVADQRRAVLALYDAAKDDPAADWRGIADLLASVVPVPKAAADAADGPEWCESAPGQHSGARGAFYAGRHARFRFGDGTVILVPLCHRKTKPAPDWSRAARMAVHYYKAKRAACFLSLVGERFVGTGSLAETYAATCQVPEIAEAVDTFRGAVVDVDRANAATAEMRAGFPYLAELVPYACEAGGCWATAWKLAQVSTWDALRRQDARRAAEQFADLCPNGPESTACTAEEDRDARAAGPGAVFAMVAAKVARAARKRDLVAAFAEMPANSLAA